MASSSRILQTHAWRAAAEKAPPLQPATPGGVSTLDLGVESSVHGALVFS